MEEGEKNTKYFLSLEKRNGENKVITQLKVEGKQKVVAEQRDILKEMKHFYANLYKCNCIDPQCVNDYVCSQKMKCLSHGEQENCEGLMDVQECKKAVFSMKRNKAPGIDGLPIEFYQVFWDDLSGVLVNALNESYENGHLARSQRKGLITLIFKKGNADELKNWRPVTLLNCDYKIVATVLALRMQKIMPTIINETQVGYIKGRLGGFNVRIVQDMIDFMKEKSLEGAMVMVDFTKAFDVIDISFIMTCLEKLNFGAEFRRWVDVLYNQAVSSVIVNGRITEQFETQRGIRQGCPLSALLFVIAVEFLANKIRKNDQIHGICFEDKSSRLELKLLQYADDTTFFVGDSRSLEIILSELDEFGKVAGPMINKEKTSLLWIGKKDRRWKLSNIDLLWTDEPVRYLGFYISLNEQVVCKANWENKLEKMQRLLDNWRKRNLTLFGRVTVVKTLVLSQVVHLLMFNSVPQVIIKKINKMFFRFLWQTKVEKVRRCDVVKNYINGGLRMVDVEKMVLSFRLRWIGRLVDGSDAIWKKLANYWFNRFGGLNLLLNSDYQEHNVQSIFGNHMPLFYIELIRAWALVDRGLWEEKPKVEKNILWHNKSITIDKKTLFNKEWFESGIIRLEDILLNGRFKKVEDIVSILKFRNSKRCAIFYYAKLRQAIPKIWLTQISNKSKEDPLPLHTPTIRAGKSVIALSKITSKYFYNHFIEQEGATTRCCFYWEDKLRVTLPWSACFKRNLVFVKESKLKEFNFKVLYNLLPVKRNLCKWNLSDNAKCNICHVDEDIEHALVTCTLNSSFWSYIVWLIQKVFHMHIDINTAVLLKCTDTEELDDFITIAFWSIYKLILVRNYTGADKRQSSLKSLHAYELRKRLKVNALCRDKPLFRLPSELMNFV